MRGRLGGWEVCERKREEMVQRKRKRERENNESSFKMLYHKD